MLKPRDIIIAYQTDRNELVGIARVVRFQKRGRYKDLLLRPIRTIRIGVRPLKKADPKIAAIPALQPGPIKTLYNISAQDAETLLSTAGMPRPEINALVARASVDIAYEQSFIEGERRAAKTTSRNPKLRLEAKKKWGLKCYCCGFDFEQFYGAPAEGAGIVHHLRLFTGSKKRKATVHDVKVVCANCHYVLHLSHRPLNVNMLRKAISRVWLPWSSDGISKK